MPVGHAKVNKWLTLVFSARSRLAPLACSIPYHTHAHAVALNTRLVHTERDQGDAPFLAEQAQYVTMSR